MRSDGRIAPEIGAVTRFAAFTEAAQASPDTSTAAASVVPLLDRRSGTCPRRSSLSFVNSPARLPGGMHSVGSKLLGPGA